MWIYVCTRAWWCPNRPSLERLRNRCLAECAEVGYAACSYGTWNHLGTTRARWTSGLARSIGTAQDQTAKLCSYGRWPAWLSPTDADGVVGDRRRDCR